jgi:hypothetical protein
MLTNAINLKQNLNEERMDESRIKETLTLRNTFTISA